MKTKILIGLLILGIVLLSGCAEKECKTAADCMEKTCLAADCKDNNCSYSSVPDCCGNEICEAGEIYPECAADCPNCDDSNECTADSYDYHTNECANTPILDVVCCGNTKCETGEDYTTCADDCPDCDDDNDCTEESYDYHGQECVNEPIMECCGNTICEEGIETSADCTADCPDCDDSDKLTADSFNYGTQECENPVTHYYIDDFEEGTSAWTFNVASAWSTTQVAGNTVLKGTGHNWANLMEGGWDDYIFKFKFKIITGPTHVNFRLNSGPMEEQTRYYVGLEKNFLGQGGIWISLTRHIPAGWELLQAHTRTNLDDGWHTFEMRGYGNILNVYVDDVLLIKYKDTENPILSGKVAFETNEGEFLIDDVEIKVIAEGDVSYP